MKGQHQMIKVQESLKELWQGDDDIDDSSNVSKNIWQLCRDLQLDSCSPELVKHLWLKTLDRAICKGIPRLCDSVYLQDKAHVFHKSKRQWFWKEIWENKGKVRRFKEGIFLFDASPKMMTVAQYVEWWKTWEEGGEMWYLTDVPCSEKILWAWKTINPECCLLTPGGVLDGHHWIERFHVMDGADEQHQVIANLEGLLYLCPPFRNIGTKSAV